MNMTGHLPSRSSLFSPRIVVGVNTHVHVLIWDLLKHAVERYTVLEWVEFFLGDWLRLSVGMRLTLSPEGWVSLTRWICTKKCVLDRENGPCQSVELETYSMVFGWCLFLGPSQKQNWNINTGVRKTGQEGKKWVMDALGNQWPLWASGTQPHWGALRNSL